MTIIFIVIGFGNLYFLIIADVLGKMISLGYTVWVDRNTTLSSIKIKTLPIANIRINILRGGKLLVANFASLFMIGVVRYTIKRNFGIVDFGQISITFCGFMNNSGFCLSSLGYICIMEFFEKV